MVFYKYKYIKYKKKYLELKQKGGEVVPIIKKNDFEIDFDYAKSMELIANEAKINDCTAIELLHNYGDYVDKVEEKNQQILAQQNDQVMQIGGENEVSQDEVSQDEISEDDINTNDENLQVENTDYDCPENQEDNPLNTLKEIDIKTWIPNNIPKNQYYTVQINNDDKNYLLKLVSSNFKYEFKKNMEDYSDEYGKLMKKENILSPLYLFKNDEDIICGYLFVIPEDYININNYFKENDDMEEYKFLEIIKGITKCFINIMKCNLKPCVIKNNIMVSDIDEKINILLTDVDELLACNNDIEEEIVRSITKFINVDKIPEQIKKSYSFNKIFKLTDYGLTLQNNIVTAKGLYSLIDKLQLRFQ